MGDPTTWLLPKVHRGPLRHMQYLWEMVTLDVGGGVLVGCLCAAG